MKGSWREKSKVCATIDKLQSALRRRAVQERDRQTEREGGSMREREHAPTTALWNAGSNNLHLTVINLDVVPAIWLRRAKGAPAVAAAPARCDHTLLLPLLYWEAVGKYVPQQQRRDDVS